MLQYVIKTLISAVLIVLISEVSRRSSLVGGLIASLPVTSLLAFIWLYRDTHDPIAVSKLATSILWLVIPSLILFIILPLLLKKQVPFYGALLIACAATSLGYTLMLMVLKKLGVEL